MRLRNDIRDSTIQDGVGHPNEFNQGQRKNGGKLDEKYIGKLLNKTFQYVLRKSESMRFF